MGRKTIRRPNTGLKVKRVWALSRMPAGAAFLLVRAPGRLSGARRAAQETLSDSRQGVDKSVPQGLD